MKISIQHLNRFVIGFFCLLTLGGFDYYSPQSASKLSDELIGVWIYDSNNNGASVFVKAQKFKDDMPGIEFIANGAILKRQNSGWCGTPPINYVNETGSWKLENSSSITINYKYWGGEIKENWELLSLTPTILKVRMASSTRIEKDTSKVK